MRRLLLLSMFVLPCIGVFGATQAKPKTAPARASLDLLVTRIDAYWKVLAKGNRRQAASYIASSDREKFLSGTTQQFRNPRTKSIELTEDSKQVIATVMVKRIVPPVPAEIDWRVIEHWQFEKGNWYRRYDPKFLPMLGLAPQYAFNTEQIESIKKDIRGRLHFEKTSFDFGTVNQGTDAVLTVRYTLTGTESLAMVLKSTAPGSECPTCTRERGIAIRGEPILSPGGDKEITVEVPTWKYDGGVSEQFSLIVKRENIEIPFSFSVQGNVYTPISISPRSLRFRKGEREKEIVVRNNSKKDLQLNQAISETKAITFDPFPVTIAPGSQLTIKVRSGEAIDFAIPNAVDRIAITYPAIDGFAGLSYEVYLNSSEEKNEKPAAPINEDTIREMMRKNPTALPQK